MSEDRNKTRARWLRRWRERCQAMARDGFVSVVCECGGPMYPGSTMCIRCYRQGPPEYELADVAAATRDGVSAEALAGRYGVTARTVCRWRRKAREHGLLR